MKRINYFNLVSGVIFVFLCSITIYPFIYAFSFSISDGIRAMRDNIILLPKGITFQNYRMIFNDPRFYTAFFISISRTFLGTLLFLIVTGMSAYAMSKPYLKLKKYFFILFIIPMYFSGGLLPQYILIYNLGLINNFWVYIFPMCFSPFFMFLMKVYLETIPISLEESARLDGAGDGIIAFKIYLPLSKPVIATVALFVGVMHWNSWFDALLYVTNTDLHPLQMVLQTILRETQIENMIQVFMMSSGEVRTRISPATYRMAVLIITTLPIVLVYPFAQKYFVKGMTIGAVKL